MIESDKIMLQQNVMTKELLLDKKGSFLGFPNSWASK